MARLLAAVAVLTALAAVGCGGNSSSSSTSPGSSTPSAKPPAKETSPPGDIPDNQAFVRYALPGGHFTVKVPEGWAQTQSGSAVTFTDKLNSVRLETAATPPTGGGATTTVHRQGGTAQRTTSLVQGKPDAVTGKARTLAVERYVFTKGGRSAVLTLSGAKGADNVDPWRIVTDSFRWTA